MQSTLRLLFFLAAVLSMDPSLSAAITLRILPATQVVQPGQTITLNVTVAGFADVAAYQFSMQWDPAVLQFQSIGYNLAGLSASNFNTLNTSSGSLTTAYLPISAVTLPDGSSLFSLQFVALGTAGSSTDVAFAGSPTAIAFYNSAVQRQLVTVLAGQVGIQAAGTFFVSGNVRRNSGPAVPSATVAMSGTATGSDLTNSAGNYIFPNLAAGSNLTLTPTKSTDFRECVSVRDMLFISKHILGLQPLGSPYQMIEADVNKSGTISTFDVGQMRDLVLGKITQFPSNDSWRFVPADFVFPNPNNPFASAFPEISTITNLQADATRDFIGMKIGDATDCVGDAHGAAFLTLTAPNQVVQVGSNFSLNLTSQGFANVSGLQFTLTWDPAMMQFNSVSSLLPGWSASNYYANGGSLSVCWAGSAPQSLPDGSAVFTLMFNALGSAGAVSPIVFSETPTRSEVVNGAYNPFDLTRVNGSVELALPPCAISCNDMIQVSLDGNCEAAVDQDQILEGFICPGTYTIDVLNGNNVLLSEVNPAVLTGSMIGLPLTATVTLQPWGNKCFAQVMVQDKLPPTCLAPPDVVTDCQHFNQSLEVYGTATATDNCCLTGITETSTGNDVLCNGGTILRSFRADDCHGNFSTCTQTIVVQPVGSIGFYIRFPNDVVSNTCSATYPEPVIEALGCSLTAMSYTDELFPVVPDACFKIERTWTVIDWCVYDPNVPIVQIPNPRPNASLNHPLNLIGPTVSAMGTAAPWAPTVSTLVPGGPLVGFSSFWSSAPAGGYQYKQIIKVIDTAPPVIDQDFGPNNVCDITDNDPDLWSGSGWFNPVSSTPDLEDAAALLQIGTIDNCLNVNIRYLLFLDLDQDGTLETVVNSQNLPSFNNVNFNNAANPGYTGGTPRPFDNRPVAAADKYGFALQVAPAGAGFLVNVRWNTQAAPGTYVDPQLPHGTHKIRWTVEDGCGNEAVYEKTFVVKDSVVLGPEPCQDEQAFLDQVAQGFTVVQQKCGLSVVPNALNAYHRVTYTWGDGSTSGPFTGNTSTSHIYTVSGYYTVCAKVEEFNVADSVCFVQDTCWNICAVCDTCQSPILKNEWAQFPATTQYLGGNNSYAQMYADAAGDFYAVSTFDGNFDNGPDPDLTNQGGLDCIVAKYKSDGTLVPGFAFNIGSTGNEIGAAIAPHPGGGFYVGGISYSPTLTLPSPGGGTPTKMLTNSILQNIFLCRYDANRNLLWGLGMHGANNLQINEMAADNNGNLYITGLAHGSIDFNPLGTAVYFPNLNESYVCKYDPNGQLLWVRLMSGALNLGLTLDASGNVYVGGHFQGSSMLSGWPMPSGGFPPVGIGTTFSSTSSVAPHVARFDNNGNFQWAFALQNTAQTTTGVVWDMQAKDNYLYVGGVIEANQPTNFDPRGGNAALQGLSFANGNFVARYDLNGHGQVAKALPQFHNLYEIEVGPGEKVYTAGYYGGATLLADVYNADLDLMKSLQTGTGTVADVTWAIAPDPFGDLGMVGRIGSQPFDADPQSADGFEQTFTDGLQHLFIGKYTCDCPGEPIPPCGPCDSIATTLTQTSSSPTCCAALQVNNLVPGYFSAVQVSVISGGFMALSDVAPKPGWTVGGFQNGTSVTLKPTGGGFFPAGNLDLASICMSQLTATDQYLEVTYIASDTICRDTLHFTCDYCIAVTSDSIGCDSAGLRKIRFCVSVSPNLGYAVNSIVLMPPTGVSISPLTFSLPNVQPGSQHCYLTAYVALPAGTPPNSLCIGFTAHEQDVTKGLPPLRCCMVKECLTLPDCLCDPDITYATATATQFADKDCCWNITLHQPPGVIVSVQTNILTPGVTYGAVAPSGIWDFVIRSPQSFAWTLQAGGTLPASIALPTLCLAVPVGSPSPQLLEIVWIAADGTICRQVLEFNCRAQDPCITVDAAQAICVGPGTVNLSITVTNTSNPPVTAGEVVLTPIGPAPFTLTPSNFIVSLAPGASTTLNATATGVTSSELWFEVHMHQTAGDTSHLTCCVAEDTLKVEITDHKNPTVVCVNGLSVNLTLGGSALVWGTDLVQYAEDNCSPTSQIQYAVRIAGTGTGFPTGQPNVTFTCADLGIQSVEAWAMDAAGNSDFCETFVIVQDNNGLCGNDPAAFYLYQNLPNPWSESTQIGFRLPEDSEATLRVFDAMGHTLHTQSVFFKKGENRFDLSDWRPTSTGVLFYSVETPTDYATKRMVVGKH